MHEWGRGARAQPMLHCLPGRGGGFYPGTGQVAEVGAGAGRGRTLNLPWPRGNLGDADYVAAFELARPARPPSSRPCFPGACSLARSSRASFGLCRPCRRGRAGAHCAPPDNRVRVDVAPRSCGGTILLCGDLGGDQGPGCLLKRAACP